MKVIGFECSGEELTFAVLEDSPRDTTLIVRETRKAPANFTRPQVLQWLRKEVHAILDKYQPENGAYKAAQPMPGRPVSQERCQFEGILMEAALSHQIQLSLEGLITKQLKKNLGLSKVTGTDCLQDLVDTKFSSIPKKYSTAVLIGLSQLEIN
ncbi:MAG: hypothetical protein Q8T09_19695 [Candidatus Melainabacteria bacterium]|nr:hypothetical protein [Candidatus Melainabacteria bacterium]